MESQFCRFKNYDLTYALYTKFPSWGLWSRGSPRGYDLESLLLEVSLILSSLLWIHLSTLESTYSFVYCYSTNTATPDVGAPTGVIKKLVSLSSSVFGDITNLFKWSHSHSILSKDITVLRKSSKIILSTSSSSQISSFSFGSSRLSHEKCTSIKKANKRSSLGNKRGGYYFRAKINSPCLPQQEANDNYDAKMEEEDFYSMKSPKTASSAVAAIIAGLLIIYFQIYCRKNQCKDNSSRYFYNDEDSRVTSSQLNHSLLLSILVYEFILFYSLIFHPLITRGKILGRINSARNLLHYINCCWPLISQFQQSLLFPQILCNCFM